jgi:hypothetical protein
MFPSLLHVLITINTNDCTPTMQFNDTTTYIHSFRRTRCLTEPWTFYIFPR